MQKDKFPCVSPHYEVHSDETLVSMYKRGDGHAGDVLFLRYEKGLYNYLKRKIRDSETAKDLVQETCVEAIQSLRNNQSPRDFGAWLYTIAKRVMMKYFEKQSKKRQIEVSVDIFAEDEDTKSSLVEPCCARRQDQPEQWVLDNELRDIRLRFEKQLSPKALDLFRLRYTQNMPFKEIEQRLDIKAGTARVHYRRTVQKFKKWLERHYPHIYATFVEEAER